MSIKSFIGNPILSPNPKHPWESIAAYNGCPIKTGTNYHLLYRALGDATIEGQSLLFSTVGIATGANKTDFKRSRPLVYPHYHWEKFGCEDPRVTYLDGEYFIFYTAISGYPITGNDIKVALALSPDLKTISSKHLVTPFNAKAMSLFPDKINGKYAAILTFGTETGDSTMAYASFTNKSDIWSPDFWQDWLSHLDHNIIKLGRLNTDRVETGSPPIEINEGWLIIYSHIQNYFNSPQVFGIEAAVLDRHDPTKVLYRTDEPLLIPQEDYELQGLVPNVIFPSGCLIEDHNVYIYYGAADTSVAMSVISLADLTKRLKPVAKCQTKLTKYQSNPILRPNSFYPWQAKAVYNPTVFHYQDYFHLLYRAMSNDNTSVIGYARSKDGYNIDYLHPEPIYTPRADFESKKIENGNSGCEDPRITLVGNELYLVYTAYNGADPPGIAFSSIALSDFMASRFDTWSPPRFISDPSVDDKDGCLLPERINGKYVFFHRPRSKGMCIDLVDDLNFTNGYALKSDFCLSLNLNRWDNLKTGVAGTPIKVKQGWLVLYHAINKYDQYYRVGAILLDTNDVTKIIAKIDTPILEPYFNYERQGQFSNVVFPCGQVVVGGRIFVYYGGGDSTIGVATASISDLMNSMIYLK